MDLRLKGKKVLVTGSTSGIGKGIAEEFLKEEATVVINSCFMDEVEKTVSELSLKYSGVTGSVADLTSIDDCKRLVDEADDGKGIDILINNLGIYPVVPFEESTDEDWYRYWEMNVMAAMRLCRLVLPKMLKRNSGDIVNISSEAGLRPNGDLVPYSTTKAAIIGMSRALAELTKGTNVTVNSVCPVTTWTDGVAAYMESLANQNNISVEEQKEEYFKTGNDSDSLLQRFLDVEEVARSVVNTAANPGINGNTVLIDAGVIRHI